MSKGMIVVMGIGFLVLFGIINYFFKILPSGTTNNVLIMAAVLSVIFILAQRKENLFRS